MEVPTQINGVKQIENNLTHGQIIGAVIGITIFALSIYAFSLSIKVNKLTLKQLKDNGYQ